MKYHNNKPKGGYFTASKSQIAATPPTPILDKLTPSDCVRWPDCGVQVCVFDASWKQYIGYTGVAVCPFLKMIVSEPQKASAFFSYAYGDGVFDEIKSLLKAILKQHPILKKELYVV